VAGKDKGRPDAGVEARFYDNEGHGLRRKHIGEVHAWLAERF
jgi:hypothetical protein